ARDALAREGIAPPPAGAEALPRAPPPPRLARPAAPAGRRRDIPGREARPPPARRRRGRLRAGAGAEPRPRLRRSADERGAPGPRHRAPASEGVRLPGACPRRSGMGGAPLARADPPCVERLHAAPELEPDLLQLTWPRLRHLP